MKKFHSHSERTDQSLPIYRHKSVILEMIRTNTVSIIQAETGSGKSTQIPKFVLEKYPDCKIVVSQPRRMAAIAVARRVAHEFGSEIGGVVGYHIKGESKLSNSTQITYMTAGILIQIVSHIPHKLPLPWDFVIMDEVHERSIEMDFLLVLFKYFLAKGKNFKLILMSATLQNILAGYFSKSSIDLLRKKNFLMNNEPVDEKIVWDVDENSDWEVKKMKKHEFYRSSLAKVQSFLKMSDAIKIFSADNRKYKINTLYLEDISYMINDNSVLSYLQKHDKEANRVSMDSVQSLFQQIETLEEIDSLMYTIACRIILSKVLYKSSLNVPSTFLVFLPGIQEISQMYDALQGFFIENFEEMDIIMLHSSIPETEHIKVLKPPKEGTQRVILSTNIAESSITLPDVSCVIDFCCSREIYFNSSTMTENLLLVWASKATMQQRAGRAGRVSEGTVYRLITSEFFKSLHEYPTPEMQRSCLDKVILKLKLMDISEPKAILAETIEPPSYEEICKTEEFLKNMAALNAKGKISRIGKIYADMPYDIKVTRLCIFGVLFHCVEEASICAAILSLEKLPISNLANLRPGDSQKHPLTYRQRLILAQDSDSDLVVYLNAFRIWYNKFGVDIENKMFKHGHRHIRSIKPTPSEKSFCETNFLELNSLRETLSNYLDIKQKMLALGLDKDFYQPNTDLNVFKLCVGASFCDRCLTSSFEISDEKSRAKYLEFLNKSPNGFLITRLQSSITESDLNRLLEINLESPSSIRICNTYAVIEYPLNVNMKTIKMAMWLGNYGRRYQNMAWVIMKEINSQHSSLLIKPNPVYLNKVPHDYRREGTSYNVQTGGKYSKTIEINYIKRPEHPNRLLFRDIITKEVIKIEEESINHIVLSQDTEKSQCYSLVCTEYTERNNGLIGRNSTILPLYPLLPYTLMLIFNPMVTYYADPESSRYLGFKLNNGEIVEFPYLFTHKDALIINNLRERVAGFLNNQDYFNEFGFSTGIDQSIMDYIKSENIPIKTKYPDWKKILNYNPPKPVVKFDHWESEGYLPPIKLLHLENYLEFTAEEIKKLQELKLAYIESLHYTSEILSCTDAELICSVCNQCICALNKASLVSESPVQFCIKSQYGSLNATQEICENEMTQFVQSNFIVTHWEVCNKNHVIGWSDDNGTYISEFSPIKILLPMLKHLEFTRKFWENDFFEAKVKNEVCKEDLMNIKFEKNCKICQEEFFTDEEFIRHVKMNEKHFYREKEFLEVYIN